MYELDRIMKCLCCNQDVLLPSKKLDELQEPVAFCKTCYLSFCLSDAFKTMAKVIYIMRSQIASLYEKLSTMERDISKLFTAQQELEEATMSAPEPEPDL